MSERSAFAVPALRLLGPSGCGKTTLVARLVAELGERGHRAGVVKSARHHAAPRDRPGGDTARVAAAGAAVAAGAFADGTVVRLPPAPLATLLAMLAPACDLVLVEGFHDAALPALVFDGAGRRADARHVIARIGVDGGAAVDDGMRSARRVPRFDRDAIAAIADHVIDTLLDRRFAATAGTAASAADARKGPRNRPASERSSSVHLHGIEA